MELKNTTVDRRSPGMFYTNWLNVWLTSEDGDCEFRGISGDMFFVLVYGFEMQINVYQKNVCFM